ncbi:MAG: sensor histidine kinase [candidate division Zixibacteria bacterium]|nr:sensor histidine kinase [candidate division Zixibacteria bacterium]
MTAPDKPHGPDNPGAAATPVDPGRLDTERRIRAYERQLRRLASELSLAEARERREIASDLHDHIGQALAYVSRKVSALKGNAVFSGMDEDFSEVLSILSQTIRYTRDLTVEISPPVLYELGLSAAIDWLAERAHNRFGLKVTSHQSGPSQPVADDIKVFMFKSVQELITNAAKHARADRVTVHTFWRPDFLEIRVGDNGCGFDTSTFESGLTAQDCFGLFSIRERLSYAGGRIEIQSAPDRGTSVLISAPYTLTDEADCD